jgi:hypothetical protein
LIRGFKRYLALLEWRAEEIGCHQTHLRRASLCEVPDLPPARADQGLGVPALASTSSGSRVAYKSQIRPSGQSTFVAVAWRRDEASPVVQAFLGVVRELTRERWEDGRQPRCSSRTTPRKS